VGHGCSTLENLVNVSGADNVVRGLPDSAFWRGMRVLVTGHTGFIGGWTCTWLHALGSNVYGFALTPPSDPSFHDLTALGGRIASVIGDVRSPPALGRVFEEARPEIVIHLAAQPIVREAYEEPLATFDVNLMGTLQVLEQARLRRPRALVAITSDKVYALTGARQEFTEDDRLGPADPYGSSKACCELAIQAYGRSFLEDASIGVASVRAGNVIGGGDWGAERLVPDAIRAFSSGQALSIRRPDAVRPWQHVLDAVTGLLLVAEQAAQRHGSVGAWNIGPPSGPPVNVGSLARMVAAAWQDGATVDINPRADFPETPYLALDIARARRELDFRSPWTIEQTVAATVSWYKNALAGGDAWRFTQDQIAVYCADRACAAVVGYSS
jgi:CDP-glucose 4,6-dehydratase